LLVFVVAHATIGLVVTVRRPANPIRCRAMHDAREVSVVRYADLKGGHVRRVVQVLGIALMTAGLLLDTSVRSRNRRGDTTSDKYRTSRLPVVLFAIGAVLLVLSSL
jgi:hypothetical protein